MTDDVKTLLGHAVRAEPALDLDPYELLRVGRRRVARRRAVLTGGVGVAVGVAVLGTSMLAAPSRLGTLPPASPAPTAKTVPSLAVKPPSTPEISQDARSQRLTSAFAAAHLIPAGMTAEGAPGSPGKPLEFFRAGGGNYQTYARLRDSRGYGRMVVNMDATMPLTDMLNCSAVAKGPCVERTFPDGSRARVHTIAGPITSPDSAMLRLTVRRPNGSFLEVYVDNSGEVTPPGSPQNPPTRDAPPLTVEQLFQIAATPTITY